MCVKQNLPHNKRSSVNTISLSHLLTGRFALSGTVDIKAQTLAEPIRMTLMPSLFSFGALGHCLHFQPNFVSAVKLSAVVNTWTFVPDGTRDV